MSEQKSEIEIIEEGIPQNLLYWTQQAIDCYQRKCKCKGCFIKNTIETECVLKQIIPKIYAIQGAPAKNKTVGEQKVNIERYFQQKESKVL